MLPRVAGVLIPLFSLRTEEDLGRGEILDLVPMIDFAREMGLGLIQLLPLDEGAPDESSPYSAMSVFAVDPVYLSIRDLRGIGKRTVARTREQLSNLTANRSAIRRHKLHLLERAWRSSHERTKKSAELETFRSQNSEWLDDYALFRSLKDRFEWAEWEQWPEELRDREPSAIAAARSELADSIARYSWLQFIAHRQWSIAHSYAREHKVILGGDMAFSPSRDSAEVWANRELFDLDRTVGAPPDAFNERGQRWGLPLPRWDRMRDRGFRLWRARVRRAGQMFDLLRIDHVVGLYRTYSFDDDPNSTGVFVPSDESAQLAQGEEILRALREDAGVCELIAEDLGSVPPWVRASLTRQGIAGYKVMQWEREEWGSPQERFVRPADYPELSLATTGTHDTETLTKSWQAMNEKERAKLVAALGLSNHLDHRNSLNESALDCIIRSLYKSPARLVVLPVQDLFGWEDQINYPGTISDSNWCYRLPFALENRSEAAEIRPRIARLFEIARESSRA